MSNEMVDLCIALNGPLVDVLLPVCYECLIKHEDLATIALHFVNKDCNQAVQNYAKARGNFHQCPDTGKRHDLVGDVAATCQWMIDNCGDKEWCFIMHFDVYFRTPWLSHMRSFIAPDVGQIGAHGLGMVGYQRSALKKCQTGLDCITNIYAVKEDDGHIRARHEFDWRCKDKSMRLWGWDVGELLELNLWHKSFKVLVESADESERRRSHPGCGSGRCLEHNATIRTRAMQDLRKLGVKPIT